MFNEEKKVQKTETEKVIKEEKVHDIFVIFVAFCC